MKYNILLTIFTLLVGNQLAAADEEKKDIYVSEKLMGTTLIQRKPIQRSDTIGKIISDNCSFGLAKLRYLNEDVRDLNPDETAESCGLWNDPKLSILLITETKQLTICLLNGEQHVLPMQICAKSSMEFIRSTVAGMINRNEEKISFSHRGTLINLHSFVESIPGLWEDPVIHAIISI